RSCSRISSSNSGLFRAISVSSMRVMKVPSVCRAYRKLNKAVLARPKCKKPVGDGAMRVTILPILRWLVRYGSFYEDLCDLLCRVRTREFMRLLAHFLA